MPFTHLDAALWTAGSTFALILVASMAMEATGTSTDLVMLGGVQLLVYVAACALFAYRRQGKSFSELFALRATSPWLLLMALLLGPALLGPAETLGRLVDLVAPATDVELAARLEQLTPKGTAHAAVLFAMAAVAAPFVEELMFRGAIFTALRPAHPAAAAVWTSAVCFTLSHLDARVWLPILVLALALSALRAQSGSLWTSYLTHAAFNGTSIAVVYWAHGKAVSLPLRYEIGGWVLSLVLLATMLLIAKRSTLAGQARTVDHGPLLPEPRGEA